MKTSKLFTLIMFFFISTSNLFADIETCPGTLVTYLDGTTISKTVQDDEDIDALTTHYYYFTPAVAGTIQVTSEMNRSYNSLFIKQGCSTTLWSNTNDSQDKSSPNIAVLAGQQIVVALERRYTTSAEYTITATFIATDPKESCPGNIITNLDGTTISAVDVDSGTMPANTFFYYNFTPSIAGTIQVDTDMSRTYNSLYIKNGCGSNLWSDTNDGYSKSSPEIDVLSGQQIVIAIERRYTTSINFNVDFTFEAASPPVITPSTFTISENALIGDNVGSVVATNNPTSYTMPTNTQFNLNSTTGEITVKSALDYETQTTYTLAVTATNGVGSDTQNIIINILDEAPPTSSDQTFNVDETATNGTLLGTISASGNPTLYSIGSMSTPNSSTTNPFVLDSNNGQLTLNNTSLLDSTNIPLYIFEVTIASSEGSVDINVTVNVSSTLPTGADNRRDFTNVSLFGNDSISINGNIIMIGNQLLCQNSSDGATCTAPPTNVQNNSINQHKARIDTSSGSPTNNSWAKLTIEDGTQTLPEADEILFARLYWSARLTGTVSDVLKNQARTIQIKGPNSSVYTTLTSPVSKFNWFDASLGFDYAASQDVTAYVKANGAGNYSVGGIQATNGTNRFASWVLIVVVQNPDRDLNNISIYDGFQSVYTGSGYPDNVTVPASGFLTPVGTEPFGASLFVYTGESENNLPDSAEIQNASGAWNYLTDGYGLWNEVFNASVYTPENGFRSDNPGEANPNFKNIIGQDIDKLEINKKGDPSKQFLNNTQTSTNIRISSKGDQYTLNLFAFETELHYPKLCYDYTYSQNDYVFTELNDGTQYPNIDVPTNSGSPITVTLYIKSLDNDVNFDHISIYSDFNLSEVKYDSSFQRTHVNAFGYNSIEAEKSSGNCNESSNVTYSTCKTTYPIGNFRTALGRPNGSGILGYPLFNAGSMAKDDFMYFKFNVMPQNSQPLHTPLSLYSDIQYSLTSGGTPVDPVRDLPFGGKRMPLCPPSTSYTPEWGIFNVIDSNLNASRTGQVGSRYLNNLLTQVVERPFSADVVALDPITDPPNSPIDINTSVAIELVDIKGFHDVNISCKEPAVRFTDRVYLNFEQESRKTIANLTTIFAKQDAAYRIWYIHDGNTSHLVENWSTQTDATGALLSITNLYEQIPDAPDVCGASCGDPATTVPRTPECYECLRTYFGYPLCSRDNFAIRPESYRVSLKDNNVSSGIEVTNNEILTPINIAAGYNYTLEINATNHRDSNNTLGYSVKFIEDAPDSYTTFVWVNTGAVCNNELNNSLPIQILNGKIKNDNTTNYQFTNQDVGKYSLQLRDTDWTIIDQGTPPHHKNNEYWLYPNADCQNDSLITDLSASNQYAYVGCNISSDHIVDRSLTLLAPLRYYDINTTFKPYTINLDNIIISHGPSLDTTFPTNAPFAYVYMSDTTNENNMSLNAIGTILAKGKNGVTLTNYTESCYADDLNFTLETLLPTDGDETLFQARYFDVNSTDSTVSSEVNASSLSILPINIFHNDANGIATLRLHYNYDNNRSATFNPAQTEVLGINPKQLELQKLNVNCVNAIECALVADQNINYETNGSISIDRSVNFYYGRAHAPRQRFASPMGTTATPAKAFIYYEVYCSGATCNRELLQDANDSKISDDSRWYINTQHTNAFGSANTTSQKGATVVSGTNPTGDAPDFTNLVYDGTKGYPYKTTMQNAPSPWLIFNRYNPTATTTEFPVEFINGDPNWSGAHETDTTSVDGGTSITNRRVMW